MSDKTITPAPRKVAEELNWCLQKLRADAEQHTNVELLDASQTFSLHEIACRIYAMGWADGRMFEAETGRGKP